MWERFEKLLESVAIGPVAIFVIVLVLAVAAWVYKSNLFCIRSRMGKIFNIPPTPGEARPLLEHSVDLSMAKVKIGNGNTGQIDNILLFIANKGKEIAENHMPQLQIERDGEIVFDIHEKIADSGITGSLNPDQKFHFNMLDLFFKYSNTLSGELKFFGMQGALIGRDFKVTAISTYTAPDNCREFTTPKIEFTFKWKEFWTTKTDSEDILQIKAHLGLQTATRTSKDP